MFVKGFFLVLCFVSLIEITASWPSYEDLIPNGKSVPNPCNPSSIWYGVGHLGPLGSGPRNPFGVDFTRAGLEWTRELCMKDSDNDGYTNGFELGDHLCQWTATNNATLQPAFSNPGICDPWDSEKCKNRNGSLNCENTRNTGCDHKKEPGIQRLDLRLKSVLVPESNWTFACQIFDFPSDKTYHLVAGEPIIDSANILGGIGVYGCDPNNPIIRSTHNALRCNDLLHPPCQDLLAVLTTDIKGSCYPHDVGITMGKNGYTKVLLRWIFINPRNLRGIRTSSGMSLYYTPNLRKFNAGIATIEDTHFSIPPQVSGYQVSSSCPSACTRKQLIAPITVISGFNMMNAHGRKQIIEVFRKGRVYNAITEDESYSVFSPNIFWYTTPVPILPGDMLKMTCEYNTMDTNKPLQWGVGKNQELCRGHIMYFPKENWINSRCDSYRTIPVCQLEIGATVYGCSFPNFTHSLRSLPIYVDLMSQCSTNGICTPECLAMTTNARRTPCLNGDFYSLWKYTLRHHGDISTLYDALLTCEADYDARGGFRTNSRSRLWVK